MGKIKVTENCNGIEGLKVIEPAVFGDARGYFMETYNYNDFAEAGIDCQFVQDNQSASKKGVLRGLHFQINYPQDKLDVYKRQTNINANCGSTHMDELKARVVYEKADAGIAFDGDADRMLAVDEKGNLVDGDQVMAICGNYMKQKGRLKKRCV